MTKNLIEAIRKFFIELFKSKKQLEREAHEKKLRDKLKEAEKIHNREKRKALQREINLETRKAATGYNPRILPDKPSKNQLKRCALGLHESRLGVGNCMWCLEPHIKKSNGNRLL